MTRLTTRSIATAEHIRDRKPFTTSGALYGETVTSLSAWSSGQLRGIDLDWFRHDLPLIDYVVWSYSTPIAWHMSDGTWHRVGQSFSITTSKHQGNLYLIDRENHETFLSPIGYFKGETVRDRWRVECDTCGTVVSCHPYKIDATQAAHTHRIAGRQGIRP